MVSAPAKPVTADWPEIRFPESCPLTEELFIQLCIANDGLRFERSPEGALVIVPFPTNRSAGAEHEIGGDLRSWAMAAGGRSTGPGAAYLLPDGSIRFADASWMTQEQWDGLGEAQDGSTFPTCPTFVVEVRSPGQTLTDQQEKMERWIGYGATLGWLVDQNSASVWVYRPDQAPVQLERPDSVSGDPELPGLRIDFTSICRTYPR